MKEEETTSKTNIIHTTQKLFSLDNVLANFLLLF